MVTAMQGDELKALRKGLGMTQAEMADAIGMTATSIGLMERGVAPIEKRTIQAARYLQVLASSHTMFALALKLEKASRGEVQMDRDELADAAEWLKEHANLPRDWQD